MQMHEFCADDMRTDKTVILDVPANTRKLYLDRNTGLLEYITTANTRQFQYMRRLNGTVNVLVQDRRRSVTFRTRQRRRPPC